MIIEKEYQTFLNDRKVKKEIIDGIEWEYIISGNGSNTLLFLNGGLRVADSAFKYVSLFNKDYKVITPTYPSILSLDKILDGILKIVKKEQVGNLFLLCQSYGGMIGEVLIQNNPNLFSKVIFSGTSPIKASKKGVFQLHLRSKLISILPNKLVLKIYKKNLLKVIEYPESEMLFWDNYLNMLFDNYLKKRDALSHFKTSLSALNNYSFDKTKNKFCGDVMVLRGEFDKLVTSLDISEMQKYYGDIQTNVISAAGHTCAFQNSEEFYRVIISFLKN